MTSSIVGVTCLSRLMAVLGKRMSTHILISSGDLGFGATTIGETHGVGLLVTFSITSQTLNFCFNFLPHVERNASMWLCCRLYRLIYV